MLEQKVLQKTKRLNALKHTTQTLERRLEDVKMEQERIKSKCSGKAQSADARSRSKKDDAMVVAYQSLVQTEELVFIFIENHI